MKATKIDLLICSLCNTGSDNTMQCGKESCESCLDFYEDIVKSMEEKEVKEVRLSSTPKRVFNLKEKEE